MFNKKLTTLTMIFLMALAAVPVFGFKIGGQPMVRLGTGARSKAFLTIYYASLYAPAELKGKSGKAIVEANKPMGIIINVDTRFMSAAKLKDAIKKGFKKCGYPTGKSGAFTKQFSGLQIKKKDKFYIKYTPGAGVTTMYKKKGGSYKSLGTIGGLGFKKALFAIWLGSNPVQSKLKRGMLGK
ncbi:MAG: chalcone isomerase family protein [Spirochaetota bacterium]